MKHLRKFSSVTAMNTALASATINILGLAYNNGTPVMKIKSGGSPVPPTPSTSTPFYVENISNEVETLTITQSGNYETSFIIEKSTDKTNWTTLGEVSFENSLTLSINPGDKVYLRAELNCWYLTIGSGIRRSWYSSYIGGVSKVGGNVMSLIYGSNFTGNETAFPEETVNNLAYLLSGWTPEGAVFNTTLIDASELLLPATTLAEGCYANMFSACTSLTTAPVLPATTLAQACYLNMFSGCTRLNYIKCLATDISASGCTTNWTSGVAASGTFVKDPNMSTSTWGTGVNGIPTNWTVQDASE